MRQITNKEVKFMEEELTKSYITMPKGFKANGVSAGMKCADPANINENDPKSSYLDVGMVYSDTLCNVAGVYTSNLVKGHSLVRSIGIIENTGKAKGIIVNSKVANAGVGAVGVEDAAKVAETASSLLGCDVNEILTASTGVIGSRLPLDKMLPVIPSLVNGLSESEETAHNAEYAMMTTDTVPKEVSAQIELTDGKTVTISGMAKGSGMIHPNLATMISIFTTDCGIDSASLKKMLQKAVKYTFNRVSVDGDTSVCDMVVIFSNGASGVSIAKLIVTSVARSPLCKTAFFGEDANIGRILTAVGYSGAMFDPEKVDIHLNGLLMYKDGAAVAFDEEEASKLLAEHDLKVDITLYEGDAYDRMFTCDFSYDYVKINGSYRT